MAEKDSELQTSRKLTPVCPLCGNKLFKANKLAKNPKPEDVASLIKKVSERVRLGETAYVSVEEYLNSIEDKKSITYHSECRKKVFHVKALAELNKRSQPAPYDDSDNVLAPPPKRGRPAKQSSIPSRVSRGNERCQPKESVCMFYDCEFCKSESQKDLHLVQTDAKGAKLITIKDETQSDSVRAAVAELIDPGDAAAKEKWYHGKCFIIAERSCQINESNSFAKLYRHLCDIEVVVYVKESLITSDTCLSMNEINDLYIESLQEKGIETIDGANHKKRLKNLILQNIPNVQFIEPTKPRECQKVALKKVVSKIVEQSNVSGFDIESVSGLSRVLRYEALDYRHWKFTGDFSTWKNPPVLEFFLKQIMIGPKHRQLKGVRKEDADKCVDVVCQMIVQNTKSDRQVNLKSERVFKQPVETPLSVGVPLALHARFRDFHLVSNLSDVFIGNEYRHLIDFEKRVEFAVLERVASTGCYCIPDFVRRGVHLWFAIDNIDFLENTAYGQNTLHGTLLVLFQRDEDGELINPPLKIPLKIPKESNKFQIKYKDEPNIKFTPIRFESYSHDFGCKDFHKYDRFTETWALASIAGNESIKVIPERLSKVVPSDGHVPEDLELEEKEVQEDQIEEESIFPVPDATEANAENISDSEENGTEAVEDRNKNTGDNADIPREPILQVTKKNTKKEKLKKEAVMPTWSATQHLLEKHKDNDTPTKTNSEPVAPLLRNSPKDWATLYTVLSMSQDISAVVVGPNKRVIITLDMDLYKQAIQLQESVKNKHWLLQPGHLHMFFADLHALGKVIEGSGLDTIAVESGIYSAAAIRGICAGKQYTRGVEYHLMNAMAIISLKLEATFGPEVPEDLRTMARLFRDALHGDNDDMLELYENLASQYTEHIKPRMPECTEGLSKFLNNYLTQVELMLSCVSAIHSRDLEGCLTAIDRKIKYYGAMDLPWYFKLIQVYLGQMNEVRMSDKETWAILKKDFVVTKSAHAFVSLFVDQGLEQEIKKLKRYGALPGITQDEDAFDRFITTSPHLFRMVEKFLQGFPGSQSPDERPEAYHQLKGNLGLRCALNSLRIRDCIVSYCQGNPMILNTPLRNITSSAIIPLKAADDILRYPEKGQERHYSFIDTRLLTTSKGSIWDPLPQAKLKRFVNWMKKRSFQVGDKVIKLREDRQFYSKCLIIAQTRPDLITKMEDLIGNYEMSVIPRANFAPDGTLLLTLDKASLMKQIIAHAPDQGDPSLPEDKTQVLIVDGMPEAQCLTKKPTTTKMVHLKRQFIVKIKNKASLGTYKEIYVPFDNYKSEGESLKYKTWAKRAKATGQDDDNGEGFDFHDEMCLKKTSIAQILGTPKSKRQLTAYLAEGLLKEYEGNTEVKLVVTYNSKICTNKPHTLEPGFRQHEHEEADTQIPMLVIHSLLESTFKHFDVYSADTDVLVLLMDLVARGNTGALSGLILHAGKRNKPKSIDVVNRVECIGKKKSQGLVGLHNFTGNDYGGKFVGISKDRWSKLYLGLPENDEIVRTFGLLGSLTAEECSLKKDGTLHETVRPLERFTSMGYDRDAKGPHTLPELRWKLWSTKNKEAENLPPCRATLVPHIQRTDFVSIMHKSYHQTIPALSAMTDSGWKNDEKTNILRPEYCLVPPAPGSILELIKCGCPSGDCSTNCCSCHKGHMPCTSLCKCSDICTNGF